MPAISVILYCLFFLIAATAFASERPNILFIMTDDHAAHAIGAYGSRINKTPNIDRLAREGMLFKNCFAVNAICTPSRASILTGKYSHKNGVPVFNRFDGSQWSVQKELSKAGYQTAMIGKWHLTSDPVGFDYWNILPGQGLYHDPEMIEMGQRKKLTGYATDLITDLTIDFVKKRDPNKPFLIFSHHKAPHREWSPDAKHAKMYEDVEIPEPPTFNDEYASRSAAASEATMRIDQHLTARDLKGRTPPAGLDARGVKKWKYQQYIKDYLRCVASVDDNVGRLFDYLEESGLAKNTVVIYTSDQGFFLGDHNWYDKRFMYEESLRMPFLVRWPGHIAAGSTTEAMALNVDVAPTFLELAGLKAPAEVQGRSLLPVLEGHTPQDWRKSMYYRYYHYPGDHQVQPHYGVRTERHKLIYFNRIDQWELFDLQTDPHELNNIYAAPSSAQTVKTLKTELNRLRTELDDHGQFSEIQN